MSNSEIDLSGTVWRDDMWLSSYPLNLHTALDYFACSPFWDPACTNVRARQLQKPLIELQGVEFRLDVVQEPHLFVIGKWRRQAPDLAAALMYYYILDGSVYHTPTIHAALSARLSDLDPLTKALAAPGKAPAVKPACNEEQPSLQRIQSAEDMQATNRIISHVLRKNALSPDGQIQQSSLLSSEPSDFRLPQVRAQTPAASGATQH